MLDRSGPIPDKAAVRRSLRVTCEVAFQGSLFYRRDLPSTAVDRRRAPTLRKEVLSVLVYYLLVHVRSCRLGNRFEDFIGGIR
jgi:hypothetical protein